MGISSLNIWRFMNIFYHFTELEAIKKKMKYHLRRLQKLQQFNYKGFSVTNRGY